MNCIKSSFSGRTCAALFLSSALVVGCKKTTPASSAPQSTRIMKGEPMPRRLSPAPVGSMRVAAGQAPLNFLVASGGPVRINDIGDDTELVRATTAPNTQISIDQQKGIQ